MTVARHEPFRTDAQRGSSSDVLVRLQADINLVTHSPDATVMRDGTEIMTFPNGAPLAETLLSLLGRPRTKTDLRSLLEHRFPRQGERFVEQLLLHGVLVHAGLADSLTELHSRTTRSDASGNPPVTGDLSFLLREYQTGRTLDLPSPSEPDATLARALRDRRTTREFVDADVPVGCLSGLLAWSAGRGDCAGAPLVNGGLSGGRTYPSGGALYPVETYVMAFQVSDVPAGVYRYQPLPHRLAWRAPAPSADQLAYWLDPQPASGISLVIVLSADWTRPSLGRYGQKAYRLTLLEAGHIAQNISTVAPSFGLATAPLCGFADEALSVGCALAHPYETALYVIPHGKPRNEVPGA
jgi:SagB-type dehydrogenase family enzyme